MSANRQYIRIHSSFFVCLWICFCLFGLVYPTGITAVSLAPSTHMFAPYQWRILYTLENMSPMVFHYSMVQIGVHRLWIFCNILNFRLSLHNPCRESLLFYCDFGWRLCDSTGEGLATLQWRHNGRDSVLNHQPHDGFLNRLFRHR